MTSVLKVDNIQNSSGTDAISIDSNGVVTKSVVPAFFAYLGTNQTASIGDWDKIEFDTTEFDTGSDYDKTTNHRFVAPVAGIYQFNTSVNPDYSSGSNTRVFGRFYKNGVNHGQFAHKTLYANDRGIVSGSITLELAVNDYVEVFLYLEGGSAAVYNGNYSYPSHFSGHLVG